MRALNASDAPSMCLSCTICNVCAYPRQDSQRALVPRVRLVSTGPLGLLPLPRRRAPTAHPVIYIYTSISLMSVTMDCNPHTGEPVLQSRSCSISRVRGPISCRHVHAPVWCDWLYSLRGRKVRRHYRIVALHALRGRQILPRRRSDQRRYVLACDVLVPCTGHVLWTRLRQCDGNCCVSRWPLLRRREQQLLLARRLFAVARRLNVLPV